MRQTIAAAILLILLFPAAGQADLFQSARTSTPTVTGDETGVTVRGGINLQTYLPPSTDLLSLDASAGGTCGAFDFVASLAQAVSTIPDLFANQIEAILTNMPMLALCYASPTLCDLAKHFQQLTNAVLQARFAQCQRIQNAMAAQGLALRGGQAAACLEEEQKRGTPLGIALDRCLATVSTLRTPSGGTAGEVELVKASLEATGASPETISLIRNLLGEVTLTAGGGRLGVRQTRPKESLHKRYEQLRAETVDALTTAVEALRAGRSPADVDLKALSLPGQPFPIAAVKALALLWDEPVRRESYVNRLATALTLSRLQWEIEELRDQLSTATATTYLSPAERQVLEERVGRLQREFQRLEAEKTTAERHLLPVLDSLLAERAAIEAEAATVGGQAPSTTPPPAPFETQAPSGEVY